MITSFGSLFAGHVDLDNEGLDGTPANDRWLSDEHLATVFPKSEAIAKLMDRTGYDIFWLAEHHFQREGYECIPNVLMLALHLCHLTKNIRIGCGFNIAPMWHPLRMAEDYATADWLTGGRVVFGVGRGYHTREVEAFGAPMLDQDANRELFEEQVDIIFKSFNERAFSHQGKHYTIPPRGALSGLRAARRSRWCRARRRCRSSAGSRSSAPARAALDFMAKHGIQGIIGGGAAPGGANEKVVHAFREALARAGREAELGEGPLHRLLVPHRRQRRAGDQGGDAVLRGEHQDVRAARLRARAHARADRRGRRPEAGAPGQPADAAQRGQGRHLADRAAGAASPSSYGDPGTSTPASRSSTSASRSARRRR